MERNQYLNLLLCGLFLLVLSGEVSAAGSDSDVEDPQGAMLSSADDEC